MNGNILLPRNKVLSDSKDAGGGSFWDGFWGKFENKEIYLQQKKKINQDLNNVIEKIESDLPFYVEIKLDEKSASKSSTPSKIFKDSNIEIISSDADNNIVVTGKKSNLDKLKSIISDSSYEVAKFEQRNTKEKQLSREIFSLQGLRNISVGIENRVDDEIQKFLNEERTNINCMIELHPDLRLSNYDEYFEIIKNQVGNKHIDKRNTELFLGRNMSFFAQLDSETIKKLLNDNQNYFIAKILIKPVISGERLIPSVQFDAINMSAPVTNEVVGVFDSGVNNKLFKNLIWNIENHIPAPHSSEHYHGTFVTGRILFGDQIFSQLKSKTLSPSCKILDIQVLAEVNGVSELPNDDYDGLMLTILEIVKRYHDKVKIYNFSIADKFHISKNVISEWTQFLDKIARKYDVLFIVCTGNSEYFKICDNYTDIFENPSYKVGIAAPSDAANVLTVGSVTQGFDENSICQNIGWPSPFTRIGNIRNKQNKPELVHFGGNVNKEENGIFDLRKHGVESFTVDNISKDSGTSFSVPLVTNQAVLALDAIKKSNLVSMLDIKDNYSNLTKALLIHSSFYTKKPNLQNEKIFSAYGMGIPDINQLLNYDPNRSTIIYCDKINSSKKIQTLKFKLPEELIGRKLKFNTTFVYNPPVDKNQVNEYQQISLSATLRTKKIELVDNDVVSNPISLTPASNFKNFKSRKYNSNKFSRESTLSIPYLEVLIQMFLTEQIVETTSENIEQSYALIIDIIDTENNENINDLLLSTNQFELMIQQEIEETLRV